MHFDHMARYYFDLYERDETLVDETGTELRDQGAAERAAIHILGSISAEEHVAGQPEEFCVKVRLGQQVVCTVRLKLELVRS